MRFVVSLMFMVLFSPVVTADELHVIINGKAIHLDDGNYNEKNWGLGFEYDFSPRKNWIKFINGSYFKDSNYQTSKYLGGGIKYRWPLDNEQDGWRIDAGLIAFLMTRKDYKNNDPFPGVLPFISVGKSWAAMNITYIPEVTPKHKDLLYFQLMFRVAEF